MSAFGANLQPYRCGCLTPKETLTRSTTCARFSGASPHPFPRRFPMWARGCRVDALRLLVPDSEDLRGKSCWSTAITPCSEARRAATCSVQALQTVPHLFRSRSKASRGLVQQAAKARCEVKVRMVSHACVWFRQTSGKASLALPAPVPARCCSYSMRESKWRAMKEVEHLLARPSDCHRGEAKKTAAVAAQGQEGASGGRWCEVLNGPESLRVCFLLRRSFSEMQRTTTCPCAAR